MDLMSSLPIIGITMGDPAGIGGEIIIKSLKKPSFYSHSQPLVIGDASYLKFLMEKLSVSLKITPITIDEINKRNFSSGGLPILDVKNLKNHKIRFGVCDPHYGKAAYEYLMEGIKLASSARIEALVTAPINKQSFIKADIPFHGHTEIFASFTKTTKFAMMLVGGNLKVVLVTRHIPLKEVNRELTEEKILTTIELTHQAGRYFNISQPKIAVCSLNPHSGEGGRIGDEEMITIIPAIKKAQKKKIEVNGPYASDTIFYKALRGDYDFIVAMYHDQGLIPLKTLYFDRIVNMTLGLPFLRTSPGHGTAYDIAGKGIACSRSMEEAIKLAIRIIRKTKPST